VVVGQPTALDPSRAPQGKGILWLQLQELPWHIKGDAAGSISAPGDGHWNDDLKNAYADRIVGRLARHIPGLHELILRREVFSPKDLNDNNINLVQGDPYSGACSIDQFLAWRPLKAAPNHKTPVGNLYHIGASTHPGPGLAGSSGYIVSQYL
jgi:phytoene dehydrogenase-like protein